ncbi:unnamed protein product [Macrosiphum euphorbiae]|uniref:Uncharacterized protein n=1 Tax=Macrosiphum euphorbiae TaxID=13131 RepID=A0AAV0XT85_9HEMI|nr:unnamed protein product [Macrosiphum euphorbiae]
MTEPYSKIGIGLTSEQLSAFKGDTNLNLAATRLTKPRVLRALQQTCSICKLGFSLGSKTKPKSLTDPKKNVDAFVHHTEISL